MTTDDMDIVSALRAALADRVGNERFALWFGPSTRLELVDGTLTIGAPNRFFRDWLSATFRQTIEDACAVVLGCCPALDFLIDASLPEPAAATAEPAATKLNHNGASEPKPRANGNDGVRRADKPLAERRRFATLGAFVTGPSNRLARAAAETILQRPGQFSPLLIHGPTSVGKTHLLEGIWSAARRQPLGPGAVYLTAEQFTTYYVEAVRGNGLPSFRQKYRGVPLLIVDDLQFFRGKRSTLVELLYTVDTILREGRQAVFAADRPLDELSDLGSELVSRLKSGMICAIDRPEHATRLGIVEQTAGRLALDVPKNVQQFIAARLTGHARELSGALCRLQATSEALGEPITLAMAEQALAEMIRHSTRIVRLPDIQKAICDIFGLEPDSLQSGRKGKRVSHPRMLAMWLARKHTRAALSEIGHFFGRRSHSTVVSAQKRVDAWLADGTVLELADHASSVDDAIRRVEQTLLAG
ncbi:MAG: DnaA/Hda family protein [Planctomycetia bacterium]|nr:DnaA/Hda family protein [Planctomycetia bacterium]